MERTERSDDGLTDHQTSNNRNRDLDTNLSQTIAFLGTEHRLLQCVLLLIESDNLALRSLQSDAINEECQVEKMTLIIFKKIISSF